MQSWNQIENGAPKGSVLSLYLSFKISSKHGWTLYTHVRTRKTLNKLRHGGLLKYRVTKQKNKTSETTVRNSFSLFVTFGVPSS